MSGIGRTGPLRSVVERRTLRERLECGHWVETRVHGLRLHRGVKRRCCRVCAKRRPKPRRRVLLELSVAVRRLGGAVDRLEGMIK